MKIINNMATTAYVIGILKAMSLYFRVNPSFRENIINKNENGKVFVFRARLQFRTRDDSIKVYAIFQDGRMKVGIGKIENPDLTLNFRDGKGLKALFSLGNNNDALTMLLSNDLSLDGNLMYLAKFGFLSTDMTMGRKKRKALREGAKKGFKKTYASYNPEAKANNKLTHRASLTSFPHDRVEALEEPFLSTFTIEDFPRLQKAREKLFTTHPAVCTERARLLTEYFLETGFEKDLSGKKRDPGLRQAEALHYIMENREPIIRDDDLIAGTTTSKDIGVLLFPDFGAVALWPELLTVDEREMNPYRISAEDIDILNKTVFPFWTDRNIMEYTRSKHGNPVCQQLENRWVLYFCWKPHAVSHTIPDFPTILQRGLLDIINEAKDKESKAQKTEEKIFFRSLQIAQEGVLTYAKNLSLQAEKMAETLEKSNPLQIARIRELKDMAKVCARVPAYPAKNLHEAVNCIWICWLALHMENMNAGLSLGRLDKWLQPFFLQDFKKARSKKKREEIIKKAIELIGCFYMKCADHLPNVPDIGNRLFGGSSSDQALTLGGVDELGNSAVSDMTYIFLKVTEMLAVREPNVNARYYPGITSDEYLKRLVEVNTVTTATPSLHNDKVIIPAMIEQGFKAEDARNWAATGCVEPTSCGKHMGHTNCMLLNTVAALEMAINDGVHPLIGEQVGPKTGNPMVPNVFPSFENFKDAYKKQLRYLIEKSIEFNNMLGVAHQELHPTPLLSSFFQGPMDKGKDVINGGAVYNSSGAALVSITDVIDSLTAIKHLIYDDKISTWEEMVNALKNNFSGFEQLHSRMLSKIPKFGTDATEPLQLGQELINFINDEYQRHKNYRGGKYTSGFWSMSNHVAFGTLSGALPSGRKQGKPFTPGITPSPGITDQLLQSIHTIAGLDPLKMPNNIAFNVKIAPGPQDTHKEFVKRVTAYTKTYFELGGMQIQFNIVKTEMLRDAMNNPENYRWLLVRISGYNAYFVELNRDMQEEIIERTEFSFSS